MTQPWSRAPLSAQERADDLLTVLRIARLGFWRLDLATDQVHCSDEFYRIYGIPPGRDSVPREDLRRFLDPEDAVRLEEANKQALARGEDYELEYRITREDGAVRILHARGHPVRANGVTTGAIGVVQDVTEARTNQALAEEGQRLRRDADFRSEFISKAAHELRTPLLPIRVQTHILATALGTKPDPRQQKALDSLTRNLDRLNRLVDDLLEASRLQSGRVKLERIPFDLSELVEDALESFRPVAEQLGVRLVWKPRRGSVVEGDPHRLMQVLHNLLGNAMKFTPAGGLVAVSVGREGAFVHLLVQDSGPGLTAEECKHLFQPFAQATAGRESKATGTGLGLYVSKGIVEEHGGRISVESPGPDQGATFKVELAFSSKPAQPITVAAQAPDWWRDAAPTERAARFRDLI